MPTKFLASSGQLWSPFCSSASTLQERDISDEKASYEFLLQNLIRWMTPLLFSEQSILQFRNLVAEAPNDNFFSSNSWLSKTWSCVRRKCLRIHLHILFQIGLLIYPFSDLRLLNSNFRSRKMSCTTTGVFAAAYICYNFHFLFDGN